MKRKNQLHDLRSLDAELERLHSQAKDSEEKIGDNILYFEQHFFQLLRNSLFYGSAKNNTMNNKGADGEDHSDSFMKSLGLRLMDRYADKLDEWIKKAFTSKKKGKK